MVEITGTGSNTQDSYASKVEEWEDTQTTVPENEASPYRMGGATRAARGQTTETTSDGRRYTAPNAETPGQRSESPYRTGGATRAARSDVGSTRDTDDGLFPRYGETIAGTTVTEEEARDTTRDVWGTTDPTITDDTPGTSGGNGGGGWSPPDWASNPEGALPDLAPDVEIDTAPIAYALIGLAIIVAVMRR